jgi:hypothetical protein
MRFAQSHQSLTNSKLVPKSKQFPLDSLADKSAESCFAKIRVEDRYLRYYDLRMPSKKIVYHAEKPLAP